MPHCQICDFEEKTTRSSYYSDYGFSNNTVRWNESEQKFLCMECRESIRMNKVTYEAELEEVQKTEMAEKPAEDYDYRDHLSKERKPRKNSKKPPTLSEVS